MERIVFLLLTMALASCSTHPSNPISNSLMNDNTIQWKKMGEVSRCKPNTVNDVTFTLKHSGHWQFTALVTNFDTRKYRSEWRNQFSLEFHNVDNEVATLEFPIEALPSPSQEFFDLSSQWDDGQNKFSDLKNATLRLIHMCTGVLEE